jgi:hypothetical protein
MGDGFAGAHTTVRVDTSSGHARITELTVRAGDGGGLAPADLPALDLDLLIRALAAPIPTPLVAADAALDERPSPTVSAGARRGGRPPRTASKDVRKTAKKAGRKAAKKAAKAGTAAKKAAPGEREGRRAYRRMPDPETVLAAYAQTGTVTGLAEHFGVPRHTATGWARRLRAEGHAIGRG